MIRTTITVAGLITASLLTPAAGAAPTPASCDGRTATITGTADTDRLVGTEGADVIAGLGGRDTIIGLGGDDVLCGDDDADDIDGGPGADRLFGGFDATSYDESGTYRAEGDTAHPGPGDDYIDLGSDTRDLAGLHYPEILDYESLGQAITVDLVSGWVLADGTDTVVIVPAITVHGTAFDDTMIGSAADDHFCGGPGDDVLTGGDGVDVLKVDNALGVGCDRSGGLPAADAGDDRVEGGPGDDQVESRTGDDVVLGGTGDDLLTSSSDGRVEMQGDDGRDELYFELRASSRVVAAGGEGSDLIGLHRGSSWRRAESRGTVTADLGQGRFRAAAGGEVASGRLIDFERAFAMYPSRDDWVMRGTSGRNDLNASNAAGRVRLLGRGGNDFLYGGGSDDYLNGGGGRDRVLGGRGRDRCLRVENRRDCERLG